MICRTETYNLKPKTQLERADTSGLSSKVSRFKFQVSDRAFTLVELMVVIAIIGVLTGIVSSSLATSKAKSRDQERVADISQIQLALAYYLDQYATYPHDLTDSKLKPFLPTIPLDPQTGETYRYVSLGACPFPTSYHLGATLELPTAVLENDKDFDSTQSVKCAGEGFNGADPFYDVRP